MSAVIGLLKFILLALSLAVTSANIAQNMIDNHDVIVFSKSQCPWCIRAKDLLKSQQIGFHVVELDALPNGQGFKIYQEIRAKTGQTTVPNIFIKGQHIGGFDSISQLHQKGLLKQYTENSQNQLEL